MHNRGPRLWPNATIVVFATLVFSLFGASSVLAAPTETILASFDGAIGSFPKGALISDSQGNLYSTAFGGGLFGRGTVFELTPPASGQTQWSATVLLSFSGPDGAGPEAGVISDRRGNLYGTTLLGGVNNQGTVFELSPPAAGQTDWTETVLYSFTGGADGSAPGAGVIIDRRGNLYGTTSGGGTGHGVVFELSPPGRGETQWSEQVLWTFSGQDGDQPGAASLLADRHSNLYGTTTKGGAQNDGVVFELTPPRRHQTEWTQTVLWSFSGTDGMLPEGTLISDRRGNLYGTTNGGGANGAGVVFELSPPKRHQTEWTEQAIWNFSGADGAGPWNIGLLPDRKGNLYGTTVQGSFYNLGVVFELTPPARGQTNWSETVLWKFGGSPDGSLPYASVTADRNGNLYGTTSTGGDDNLGTAFQITLDQPLHSHPGFGRKHGFAATDR